MAAFGVLGLDVFLLALFVVDATHYWMGDSILVGSFVAIGALIYLAYRAPSSWPTRRLPGPRRGIRFTFLAGLVVYPVVILIDGLTGRLGSPLLTLLVVIAWEYASLRWVTRNMTFAGNERHLIVFALGLLTPLLVSGLVANFPVDLAVLEDVALLLFFRYLFRMYPPVPRRDDGQKSVDGVGALISPGIPRSAQSSSSSLSATASATPRTFFFGAGG